MLLTEEGVGQLVVEEIDLAAYGVHGGSEGECTFGHTANELYFRSCSKFTMLGVDRAVIRERAACVCCCRSPHL
jgi:hypothetical protein